MRPLRYTIPGQPQHVIQRGVNRQPIFFGPQDYYYCLNKLTIVANENQCDIHAYVLMTNHFHFLVTPHTPVALAKMIQGLGRYYVPYINKKYGRTGTLWQGRYKTCVINSERYLLTCYRYIELNPVRANIVTLPEDYLYSSYHANALGRPDSLIKPHSVFESLAPDLATRQANYRQLFQQQLNSNILYKLRNATKKGRVLT